MGSVATGELVAPPPLAVAELVRDPGGVVAGTVTFSVIEGNAPAAAMLVVLVQVTT